MTLRASLINRRRVTVGLILLAGVMYSQTSPQGQQAPRAVTDRELLSPIRQTG
jgi:hypothetical protein